MSENDNRSLEKLLADAAKARDDARRHHTGALLVYDHVVEETLRARATELEALADALEARATKLRR